MNNIIANYVRLNPNPINTFAVFTTYSSTNASYDIYGRQRMQIVAGNYANNFIDGADVTLMEQQLINMCKELTVIVVALFRIQ
jgi:hypothetical protein